MADRATSAPPATNPSPSTGTAPSSRVLIWAAAAAACVAAILAFSFSRLPLPRRAPQVATSSPRPAPLPSSTFNMSTALSAQPAPVWFVSHGGPPTMFEYDHPAYKAWTELGKQIVAAHDGGKGPLKALLVISAHWQANYPGTIEVNTDEKNPLVYDYYGFPQEYYKVKVESHNPSNLSKLVLTELNKAFSTLNDKDLKEAVPTRRGLDHGVFVPFKVAFYPSGAALPSPGQAGPPSVVPSTLPVVQITLPASDDAETSYRLGTALRALRHNGVGVFSGGMGVHNMRDFMMSFRFGQMAKVPYASFTDDIAAVVALQPSAGADAESAQDPRGEAIVKLQQTARYRGAHPTAEHFLPIPLAVGATLPSERLYSTVTKQEGAMGWNMFGTLPKSSAKA